MEIERHVLNHIDCLSREKVRASLIVNLGYAQRINCFLEFQEVLRGNEAHNFRSRWKLTTEMLMLDSEEQTHAQH